MPPVFKTPRIYNKGLFSEELDVTVCKESGTNQMWNQRSSMCQRPGRTTVIQCLLDMMEPWHPRTHKIKPACQHPVWTGEGAWDPTCNHGPFGRWWLLGERCQCSSLAWSIVGCLCSSEWPYTYVTTLTVFSTLQKIVRRQNWKGDVCGTLGHWVGQWKWEVNTV